MAITCYKNYGTPPNSTGVPATRTRYALASEIGLLAGHACVLARLLFTVAQKPTLVIGVGACCGPLDARCGAKSIGLFAIRKKSDAKIASWAVVASKLDSRIFIVLLRGKYLSPLAWPTLYQI